MLNFKIFSIKNLYRKFNIENPKKQVGIWRVQQARGMSRWQRERINWRSERSKVEHAARMFDLRLCRVADRVFDTIHYCRVRLHFVHCRRR